MLIAALFRQPKVYAVLIVDLLRGRNIELRDGNFLRVVIVEHPNGIADNGVVVDRELQTIAKYQRGCWTKILHRRLRGRILRGVPSLLLIAHGLNFVRQYLHFQGQLAIMTAFFYDRGLLRLRLRIRTGVKRIVKGKTKAAKKWVAEERTVAEKWIAKAVET